jgi:ATP-dependent Clp protease ATP-binding subunit ClpA
VAKKPAAKKAAARKPELKGKDGGKRSLVPQLPRKG